MTRTTTRLLETMETMMTGKKKIIKTEFYTVLYLVQELTKI
jgi:hypothetical protein